MGVYPTKASPSRGKTLLPGVRPEAAKAIAWGLVVTAGLAVLIVIGSRRLSHFDVAIFGYMLAVLFSTFGLTYRYSMWLQRPPTAIYWRRGWTAFFKRGHRMRNAQNWVKWVVGDFVLNRFIWTRDHLRGLTHFLIMWGCIIAVAITFPLVFGWLHFETVAGKPDRYQINVFGFSGFAFPTESFAAYLLFHGLVWSAFLTLAGVMLALRRRMRGGSRCGSDFFRGFSAVDSALCREHHRTHADRVLYLDERLRVYISRQFPCNHGDRYLSLAALWQVLPHFPAPCPNWGAFLQRCGRA